METIWKTIPNFPNYEASNDGRVRRDGKELKPQTDKDGYKYLQLCVDGKHYYRRIHRLVLFTFVGNSNLAVRHLDGNPANNNLENLAYGTAKQNGEDKVKHGTSSKKLTAPDIHLTRMLISFGWKHKQVAEIMGVARSTISQINNRLIWSHI